MPFFETRLGNQEISALLKAHENNPVKNLTIVTFNGEETISEGNLTIEVVPVWKWILRSLA